MNRNKLHIQIEYESCCWLTSNACPIPIRMITTTTKTLFFAFRLYFYFLLSEQSISLHTQKKTYICYPIFSAIFAHSSCLPINGFRCFFLPHNPDVQKQEGVRERRKLERTKRSNMKEQSKAPKYDMKTH